MTAMEQQITGAIVAIASIFAPAMVLMTVISAGYYSMKEGSSMSHDHQHNAKTFNRAFGALANPTAKPTFGFR